MNRREALRLITAGTASMLLPSFVRVRSRALKIGIVGGKVFYNGSFKNLFVGIDQNNRLVVSDVALPSEALYEVHGKVVSAGFIDILGDNSSNPERTYHIFEKYKVTDGLTTVLQMHGGSGDPAAFYDYFGRKPHYVNYGVSTKVMSIRYKYSTVAARLKAVERALEAGALGVSHSLEYQPTPYDEVLAYARLAHRYERPFVLHLRYSSPEKELEGVKEAIRLAADAGVHLHIAHLHSTGGTYHMAEALELIAQARARGLRITTCVYPYSYWATYLHSKRFDPGWRSYYGLDYSDLVVVGTGERLTPARFEQLRRTPGVLVAVPEGTMPLHKTVDLALQTDFCMIGSDGGIEREPRANSHPRGAGCFATAIRHALSIGLPLEKILTKMTTLPASLAPSLLQPRAAIENGRIADITVFDPETIEGMATVSNPNRFSKGIELVVVNGEVAYEGGLLRKQNGQAIRY
ncbi:MAG: N-acyl-D-glutamate deacylase [Thermonema sp.]|uniref:amidohydrolase family protein n=1 Tax=Thermonema sp. TaxID=2231181 RepID=UPI0021DD7ABC|nr:amidohydrolase family protein [Thermonema sp.]GIV38827.1 MAG: N-acyl-D-glutamate deacylase [Thermonema sp.]